MPIRRKTLEEFFWERVSPEPNSGCWLWTGRYQTFGYGDIQLYRNAPHISAHRASWSIHSGDIPDGMCVCHKCDVPECVNPDHLFLGSQQDNMLDAHKKGRLHVIDNSWRKEITHCRNGHPWDKKNTYMYKNARHCRKCRAAADARRREHIANEAA